MALADHFQNEMSDRQKHTMQYECTTEQQVQATKEIDNQTTGKEFGMDEQTPTPQPSISKSEALRMVRERWPEAFRVASPRPLKVGIHNEMKQTGEFPLTIIKSALKLFTSQERYLMSIKLGRSRIDLNGKPAGKVKLKEAVNAEIMLFQRQEKLRRKHERIHVGQLKLMAIGPKKETREGDNPVESA